MSVQHNLRISTLEWAFSCEGKIITVITYGDKEDGGEDYVTLGVRLSSMILRATSGYAVDAIPLREYPVLTVCTAS